MVGAADVFTRRQGVVVELPLWMMTMMQRAMCADDGLLNAGCEPLMRGRMCRCMCWHVMRVCLMMPDNVHEFAAKSGGRMTYSLEGCACRHRCSTVAALVVDL